MSRKKSHNDEITLDTPGKRLRYARKYLGLNQHNLALSLGIKQNTLSEWERDVNELKEPYLSALEYRHKINSAWLLTGQGPMRRGQEAPAAGEPVQPYTTTNEKHAEVFALVREILESGDDLIIRSFHERLKDYRIALRRNDETRSLKQQLGSLERKFKALEQRIGPPMEAGASADADAEAVGAADAGSEKKAI